jgi:hypothetical protein
MCDISMTPAKLQIDHRSLNSVSGVLTHSPRFAVTSTAVESLVRTGGVASDCESLDICCSVLPNNCRNAIK